MRDIVPAITISLRELPKRLVISCDGETVSISNEDDETGITEITTTRLQNVFKSKFAGDAFEMLVTESVGKTFKITRSANDVSVTIDDIAVNFGGNNDASVVLEPGLHLLVAFIRGMPGAKGSVEVDGIGTAEMEIAHGTNSDFATIKIRA
ncbi:hypothetical protein OVY48_12770 [Sphingobium sp. SA2]|uniref:hypothetical protein n=1 Tax=Sphingobium sp. SA2 TaxID=1524832 RepID=UPI0028C359CB|nr:hypothetical protein [Sphingobium sp. SA2]MDT7534291.1 hypothetical protein [Sphingobium sp. SA2]